MGNKNKNPKVFCLIKPLKITFRCLLDLAKSEHHVVPKSRFKDAGFACKEDLNFKENLLEKSNSQHQAWHLLFGNLMSDEVETSLKLGWKPRTLKQKQAWYVLFGLATARQIFQIINSQWSLESRDLQKWRFIKRNRRMQNKTMVYAVSNTRQGSKVLRQL